MGFLKHCAWYWRTYVLILAPLALIPLVVVVGTQEAKCGFVILLVAIYWMTEAIPIAVASLLPLVLLPVLGIQDSDKVCINYMKETNVMAIGAFAVAVAFEQSNLHKRIALRMLLMIGTSPRCLMLGFLVTSMVLSMWMHNMVTTAMLVPIVICVLDEIYPEQPAPPQFIINKQIPVGGHDTSTISTDSIMAYENTELNGYNHINHNQNYKVNGNGYHSHTPVEHRYNTSNVAGMSLDKAANFALVEENLAFEKKRYRIRTGILLAVAYGANLGGTGTLTGTNPNLVLRETISTLYGDETSLNYTSWMFFNVPGMCLCALLAWIWLQFFFIGCESTKREQSKAARRVIKMKHMELGPISFHEFIVFVVFLLLVAAWIMRNPDFTTGWSSLFPKGAVKDSAAAIAAVFLLFALPARLDFLYGVRRKGLKPTGPGPAALDWKLVQEKIPWGVLILMGGGVALADASKVSGLSKLLGEHLVIVGQLPSVGIVAVVSSMTAMLTEVASNTATANILLPVLYDLSQTLQIHPLYLMMPVVVASSYAFMLPIATPPNAVVFEIGNMRIKDMLIPGFIMNILCVGVLMLTINTLGMHMFQFHTYPKWAYSKEMLLMNRTIAMHMQNNSSLFDRSLFTSTAVPLI